jgi:hypothetical protein
MLLNAKLPGVMVDRLYEIFEYGRQQKINWKIEKKKQLLQNGYVINWRFMSNYFFTKNYTRNLIRY